jgi:hypothetical protein
MRLLMNILLAPPYTALDACVPAKTSQDMLGLSPLSSWPLRSPALAIRGYWRGAITTLNLLTPFNPAS